MEFLELIVVQEYHSLKKNGNAKKKDIATIKFADRCGYYDFILPISSWINFGGESQAPYKII